jgi:hypothetical protein
MGTTSQQGGCGDLVRIKAFKTVPDTWEMLSKFKVLLDKHGFESKLFPW